jgi:hypothetical protein
VRICENTIRVYKSFSILYVISDWNLIRVKDLVLFCFVYQPVSKCVGEPSGTFPDGLCAPESECLPGSLLNNPEEAKTNPIQMGMNVSRNIRYCKLWELGFRW